MTTIEAPKTTPKEVTTADVLERAADFCEEGWGQEADLGRLHESPYCISTALSAAERELIGEPLRGWDFNGESLTSLLGFEHGPDIVDWNDAPGRTKSEVVSLLRQAAERSRETA